MFEDLLDLLKTVGVDPAAQQITLMRHKDKRYPLVKYIGTRALNLYQAMQPREMPVGSLLVAFYGNRPGHALLLGVWRVEGVLSPGEAIRRGLLEGSFEPLNENWGGYYHDLRELDLLADLRLKLEIEWTGKEVAWRRVLRPTKAKRERRTTNLPNGHVVSGAEPGNCSRSPMPMGCRYSVTAKLDSAVPFQGLTGVSLVMAELRIALRDAAWQQGLAGVFGIYLITDERGGQHYVGSASGAQGLLQRWSNYATTGHGGNKLLTQMLAATPGRELDLRFTLLEVLPAGTPRQEVIRRESYWKVALGSRTFGLNLN
ncbi:GIY-YIG nuclease family protein [Paraburkholderia terrae]|uniref:GIY-YIG nuclease family protein n=1 Tax=Paraburkholderia terrae TaxID=311230 RepID=UPI0020BE7F1D|nr:GIY-YIG nuclease family protein [Paraburkholderia terrae]